MAANTAPTVAAGASAGSVLSTKSGPLFVEHALPVVQDYDDIPAVENSAWETHWYRRYFCTARHDVFIAKHEKLDGVVALAVLRDDAPGFGAQFRVLVVRSTGIQHAVVAVTDKEAKALDTGKDWKLKDLLHRLGNGDLYTNYKKFRFVSDPAVVADLLEIEDYQPALARFHQFGVLLGLPGQTSEAAMLENAKPTPAFDEFLSLLGTRFAVRGWTGFAGALDVVSAPAGAEAVRRELRGHEVLLHVSVLLPDAGQRLASLGAHAVRIVFLDGAEPFDLESLEKTSTVVLALVSTVRDDPSRYAVSFVYERGTPLTGPPMRTHYRKGPAFVQNLLVKLINLERALTANSASRLQLASKAEKSIGKMLEHMNKKHYNKKNDETALRGVVTPPAGSIGMPPQTESVLREQVILEAFPQAVTCIAPWDEFSLFYGTSDGIFLLDKISSSNLRLTLAAPVASDVIQLAVLKAEGVLVALSGGSSSLVHVLDADRVVTKKPRIKSLPQTNKAHIFTLGSVGHMTHLCVAVHSEVIIFHWDDFDHTFVELDKIRFPARPVSLVIAEDGSGAMCVAFRSQFVLLNLKTEAITPLHEDVSTVPLVAHVIDNQFFVGADGPSSAGACSRWLLCYQKSFVLVRAVTDAAGTIAITVEYAGQWLTPPLAVNVLPPYILAASICSLEVRSLISGALLETGRLHLPAESSFVASTQHAGRALYIPASSDAGRWRINRYTPQHMLDEHAAYAGATPPIAISRPSSLAPGASGSGPSTSPRSPLPPPPGPPPGWTGPTGAAAAPAGPATAATAEPSSDSSAKSDGDA